MASICGSFNCLFWIFLHFQVFLNSNYALLYNQIKYKFFFSVLQTLTVFPNPLTLP